MGLEIVAPSCVSVTETEKNLVARQFVPLYVAELSVTNPLHVLNKQLLRAAVVKFCGPAVGVASDTLGDFQ
jgi:hypothetical protein